MKFSQGPGNRETEVLLPGERSTAEGRAVGNRILLALPEAEYQTLRPLLSSVVLTHHASLHEPGDKIEFVYFPNSGLVSLVVAMKEGKTVEVGVVGNEGLVGTPAVVGLDRSPHRAIVQITGDGLRIQTEALRSVLPETPQLCITPRPLGSSNITTRPKRTTGLSRHGKFIRRL